MACPAAMAWRSGRVAVATAPGRAMLFGLAMRTISLSLSLSLSLRIVRSADGSAAAPVSAATL